MPPWCFLDETVAAIRHAWLESLRYSHFEAHYVERKSERARVHKLTQVGPNGLWVMALLDVLKTET
jgi:hypothetical protein